MKTGKGLAALLLLVLSMFMAACGSTNSAEPDKGSGSSEEQKENEVTAVLEHVENDVYRYTVDNQTDELMTFEFTSGQRYDYTISNDAGEELYRMSSVSMFMQALGEESVQPGDKLEYDFEIPAADLEAGDYELKAWLTPKDGEAYKEKMDITVK